MAKKKDYGNEDIVVLKGPDKVRKRPAVIFGSDDLIGCQHSFIEILANSVDEAREGYGDKIIVKKDSSKKNIHLDILLNLGYQYEVIYSPRSPADAMICRNNRK